MSLINGVLLPSRAVKITVRVRRSQNGEEGTRPVGEDRHEGESGLSPSEQSMERSYTATYLPLLPRVKANFPTKVGWNVRQNSCSIQSLPVGTQLPRNQPGTLS